jgi:hypothetical protein
MQDQGVSLMLLKTFMIAAATAATLTVSVVCPASAGGMHGGGSYGGGMTGGSYGGMGSKCKTGGGISIYKPVTINKNVNINKNINIYKPVTINKNIDITKNIDNSKNININKNVNINKNININKTIVINKGGGGAEAQAFAAASASATANASAGSVSYSAAYSESTVINHNGGGGEVAVAAEQSCQMTEATVVKALHVVCVTAEGREFPASHMLKDTWVESGYEGEVARCIPGATIKAVIGDVVQSDEGMAGTYASGQVLACGVHEALRHYKDGMLKCAPAVPVKDCTERTNLRLYGTGDFFFSYRAQVCATMARKSQSDLEVTGMSLDGGVGDGGN